MKQTLANYLCLKCDFSFNAVPSSSMECIKCGHLYLKWTNFEQMFRRKSK